MLTNYIYGYEANLLSYAEEILGRHNIHFSNTFFHKIITIIIIISNKFTIARKPILTRLEFTLLSF
jgi:hypothetical protein